MRPAKTRRVRRTQAERSESTQRRIVDSAMSVIHKQGFQKANLTNIARGAKVTLGALQHHFGTRQALLERVVNEVMAPLHDHGQVWPSPSLPLPARAEAFVRNAWEHIHGPPTYVAAWALFFGCKSTPSLFKRIDMKRAHDDPIFFAHFLDVFPEVRAEHRDPDALASFVFATLRGIGVFKLFPIPDDTVERQLACLSDVIVAAGTRRA